MKIDGVYFLKVLYDTGLKVEAVLKEAGYDGDIYKPLGNHLF